MAGTATGVGIGPNPYVGPRPFETGETIFGREREITELYYLLSAERIVLLYSPSGAGKSSLIQAGLIPLMRRRFDVWRPTRVNTAPPAGLAPGVNRYVLSAISGFEQSVPDDQRRSIEEISRQSLSEYVGQRPRQPGAPVSTVLIFDQFEEVLTVDPLGLDGKRAFFDQLGELLHDPHIWALFAMREDYLAPFDPYAQQVPTHLLNRFRIDRLQIEKAAEALSKPALQAGREFAADAVKKLVGDLATMKVQQPDGTFKEETGRYVEPLQLQVVGRGLWDHIPENTRVIGADDVARFGNVSDALSRYYDGEVRRIADADERKERAIREWMGDKLITAEKIRGQVLKGAGKSEGLDNELIAQLVNTHLVRSEQRAGAVWYELAHDRLIEPVRTSNEAWRELHLHEVQKVAAVWESQGEPAGLLLLGSALASAQQWAKTGAGTTEIEQKFLKASEAAQAAAEKERRQVRRTRLLAIVAAIGLVLSLLAGGFAVNKWQESNNNLQKVEEEKRKALQAQADAVKAQADAVAAQTEAVKAEGEAVTKAEAARKAEEATSLANSDRDEVMRLQRSANQFGLEPQLNLLLSVHGSSILRKFQKGEFPAIDLLRHQLQVTGGRPLIGHKEAARSAAFSADQRWLATASDDGEIRLWDVAAADPGSRSIRIGSHDKQSHGPRFLADPYLSPHLAFSPDGKWLVSGGDDGAVRLWRLTAEGAESQSPQKPGYGAIRSLAISSNGQWVAFGTEKGNVCIWPLSSEGMRPTPCVLGKRSRPVNRILWSSGGRWLASAHVNGGDVTGGEDGTGVTGEGDPIELWDTRTNFPHQRPKFINKAVTVGTEDETRLLSFAFSGDETLLAVTYGYNAQVWDLRTQNPSQNPVSNKTTNYWMGSVGVGFDNRWLVLPKSVLWDLKSPAAAPRSPEGNLSVSDVFLTQDGKWLATPQDDGLHLYDLASPFVSLAAMLVGQDHPRTQSIVFSAGTDPHYVAGLEGLHPRLWTIPDPTVDPVILRAHEGLTSAAMSAAEGWIASCGQGDHKLIVRNLRNPLIEAQVRQLPSAAEVAVTPNGRFLATRDVETGKVGLYTFPNLVPQELPPGNGGDVIGYSKSFGFTPDSRWLVSGYFTEPGRIGLWNIAGDNKRFLSCQTQEPVRALAFSADGRFVFAGMHGFVAHVLDLQAPDPCAVKFDLGPHKDNVDDVAISPDLRWAATASFDGHGRLWEMRSCQLAKGCQPVADVQFSGRSTRVAFSPDSHSVAFSSLDSTIQLLNVGGPYPLKPLLFKGHTTAVAELSFSPDSRWVISAGADNTIRIWDRSDPKLAPVILRSEARVRFMGFSKDGRKLITAGDDGTIRIWRLKYEDLVELACQTAGRQLSRQEVKDYLGGDEHDEATCANQPKVKE